MVDTVIDTNVPIVANGDSKGVCLDCEEAAIRFLLDVVKNHRVLVDLAGECQAEYHRYLNPSGQPKVGDQFYKQILMSAPEKVLRLDLEKDAAGNFVDLADPINTSAFDLSDRKFAALSVAGNAPVYHCVDSDWVECLEVLEDNGVQIEHLCGTDIDAWRC